MEQQFRETANIRINSAIVRQKFSNLGISSRATSGAYAARARRFGLRIRMKT
jgi:hypothetical protein